MSAANYNSWFVPLHVIQDLKSPSPLEGEGDFPLANDRAHA